MMPQSITHILQLSQHKHTYTGSFYSKKHQREERLSSDQIPKNLEPSAALQSGILICFFFMLPNIKPI